MQALGLIETVGLLPAIEGADVMLKTAQVELVERTYVGGGLVTIVVTGDVGAVKAAVEAAVIAVEKIGHLSLVSHHVIPRPHQDIESMVVVREDSAEEQPAPAELPENFPSYNSNTKVPLPEQDTIAEPAKTTQESKKSEKIKPDLLRKEAVDVFIKDFGLEKCLSILKTLSVVKLRNLAKEYKELGVAGRAISKAKKELIIQKLKEYYEPGSEK